MVVNGYPEYNGNSLFSSVQTASFYTTPFPEVLKACIDAGFNSVELGLSANTICLKKEELIRMVSSCGVEIRSIHQRLEIYYNNTCYDLYSSIEEAVNLADFFGKRRIVVHGPFILPGESDVQFKKRWKEFLFSLTQYVPLHEICVENLDQHPQKGPFPVFWTWEEYVDLLSSLDLFICFDTAHAGRDGDIWEPFQVCRDRTKSIHFSDRSHGEDHFVPGDGELNLEEFYRNLSDDEKKLIVLEVDASKNYPALQPEDILEKAKRSFTAYMQESL